MGEYRRVSQQFVGILRSYSPVVEVVSVDEAYLDMQGTERLFGPPEAAGRAIKAQIHGELKVTASIGIAGSKLVAKVASDECKPDGLLMVPDVDSAEFLAPLPVRKLPGLGPKAERALAMLDITTLGQLAAHPAGPIVRILGDGTATALKRRAAGIDDSRVSPGQDAKSISAETTFSEDSDDLEFLHATLLKLSERVGARVRASKKQARSIGLKLRYYDFATVTRQLTVPEPVDGDDAIYGAARSLLTAALRARCARVRLLGVGVDELVERSSQLALIESPAADDSKLSAAVDRIRERFGRDAIKRASVLRVRDD